ncbi:conserved hypothetical protein, partial [Ricinus communis]
GGAEGGGAGRHRAQVHPGRHRPRGRPVRRPVPRHRAHRSGHRVRGRPAMDAGAAGAVATGQPPERRAVRGATHRRARAPVRVPRSAAVPVPLPVDRARRRPGRHRRLGRRAQAGRAGRGADQPRLHHARHDGTPRRPARRRRRRHAGGQPAQAGDRARPLLPAPRARHAGLYRPCRRGRQGQDRADRDGHHQCLHGDGQPRRSRGAVAGCSARWSSCRKAASWRACCASGSERRPTRPASARCRRRGLSCRAPTESAPAGGTA